jgi:transposase-like protein
MKTGRPTRYTPEHAHLARLAYELGATDEDVAAFLTIDISTLYRWRNRHPAFAEAAEGKADADKRVEFALYRRAIGYEYQVERAFMPVGAEKPVIARHKRHVAADPRAALSWLRIRRPDLWSLDNGREAHAELGIQLEKALRRVADYRGPDVLDQG